MKVCACGRGIKSVNPKARRCGACWFCKECGKNIPSPDQPRTFCSHRCAATWHVKNNQKVQQALSDGRHRVVFVQPGQSQQLDAALPKACELCGYARVLQMAHIVPKRKEGPAAVYNLLRLCPNCHWLYDHAGLTAEELERLQVVIEQRRLVG